MEYPGLTHCVSKPTISSHRKCHLKGCMLALPTICNVLCSIMMTTAVTSTVLALAVATIVTTYVMMTVKQERQSGLKFAV